MDDRYQYLALMAACVLVTLPLEFLLRARVYRRPVRLALAMLPTLVVFVAWDMLGIPAALHTDAVIEAKFTESNDLVKLEVKNGKATNPDLLIHFPLAFSRWYDDLVYT